MASVPERLKERSLVQWAIAYLAGAWVIFEVSDAVGGRLGWPDVLYRGLLVILAVGFCLALVIAWYHGERGRQRVSGPELLMVGALLVIAGGVLSILRRGGEVPAPEHAALPPIGEDDRPALAVLPFDNLSPDPENEFFTDGIHDEIIAQLSRISGLKVISRTSVMEYKGRSQNLRTVAEELNVTNVLEGTVRRANGRVRITAQLIDALADEHLWTETYDRGLSHVFAVQSDVAQQVAAALKATLTPAERERMEARATESLEAYDHYLRGRSYWHQRSRAVFDSAISCFNQAILLDPGYARAYAALAETYVLLPEYGGPSMSETLPLARAAIERALTLDPGLAEAYTASGYVKSVFAWDWAAAERDFARAIELNPNYATAHQWYGELLGKTLRWDEALVEARRAVEMDPLSPAATLILGILLASAGRSDEAMSMHERALRIVPDWVVAINELAKAHVLRGDYARAAPLFDRLAGLTGTNPEAYRAFLDALTNPARLEAAVTALQAPGVYSTISAADYLAILGRVDEALTVLEQEYERRNPRLPWVNGSPMYAGLRSDPRFQDLLRRMNLPSW